MMFLCVAPLFLFHFGLFRKNNLRWIPFALMLPIALLAIQNISTLKFDLSILLYLPIFLELFWKVLHSRLTGFNPFEMSVLLGSLALERMGFLNIYDLTLVFWITKSLDPKDSGILKRNILLLIPFIYTLSRILINLYGLQLSGADSFELKTANLIFIDIHLLIFISSILIIWTFVFISFKSFLKMDEFKNFWDVLIGAFLIRTIVNNSTVHQEKFEILIITLLALNVIRYLVTKKDPLVILLIFSLIGDWHLLAFLLLLPLFGPGLNSRLIKFQNYFPTNKQLISVLVIFVSSFAVTSVSLNEKIIFGLILLFLISLMTRVSERYEVVA